MTIIATVRKGKVVLPKVKLPDGAKVRVSVEPVEKPAKTTPLGKLFREMSARLKGADLPADLAAQHDHYLYGTPKR